MDLRNKLNNIFLNESIGGMPGVDPKGRSVSTPGTTRINDARRKRIDRQGEQRKNRIQREKIESKAEKKGEEPPHPRLYLQNELRLTLKESFISCLLEYLNTNKRTYLNEALKLMEEYPNLNKFVYETSVAALPKQPFSVYSSREHHTQQIGETTYRSGDGPHVWTLSRPQVRENYSHIDNHAVMECKISPTKALLYVPAFTKMMEELVFSGKIEEPTENVIRRARNKNEIVLPSSIDSGMIVEIINKD